MSSPIPSIPAPTLTVEDIAAVKVALTPAIHDEIAALLPVLTTDIEDALEGKTTIPAPVWIAAGVVVAAILSALGYLLIESVSYGNHVAADDLGTISTWLGLGTIAGGGVLLKSPLSKA